MLQATTKTFALKNGQEITLETGKMARQADGSVLVKQGNAVILATVVSSDKMRDGIDFFPLSVDYFEKFAAAGRIPGSFMRREGRPSAFEILISRLVDRALRPLFPDEYFFDTQVIIQLISADPEVMTDSLAALAASAALTVSDIPFLGPISEVRVARINGEYIVNPLASEMAEADMDLIVAATEKDIMMVEGEMKEVSEQDMVDALKVAHEAIIEQCQAQRELAEAFGIKENREVEPPYENPELKAKISELIKDKIHAVASTPSAKHERKEQFGKIKEELKEKIAELYPELPEEDQPLVGKYFSKIEKHVIRECVLNTRKRLDGRDLDEVRPLDMEVDLLPSTHGSALFTRGETQSICTVTLGNKQDEQMVDKAAGLEFDRFLLHYNFPPFSVGEARPLRSVGRREIGHGNLAMRSIKQVMPPDEENPYTIRIVSDILESNGSSSMATVCGGSLALMDSGIKIKSGISGVAMGMIADPENPDRYAILTDILGDEDHLGDMDFKVTGTKDGICGCQMDIKIDGLSYEKLAEALEQARKGRLHILEQMNTVIAESRPDFKPHAPRIEKIFIKPEYIGAIIGPGGKHIQELQKETETNINIEEKDDVAEVLIASSNKDGIERAKARIRGIASEPEVGEVYESVVKSIMPYGAFVEFMPNKQGLLHISEVAWERLNNLDGIMEEGDTIQVKLLDIDKRSGKYKLSRKVLLERPPRSENGGDRGGRRDNRNGGGDRRDRDHRRN